MRSCELCGKDFELKQGRGFNNRVSCYACTDNPDSRSPHYRNKHLKRKYGLTLYEAKSLYQQQNGNCAICDSKMDFDTPALRLGKARGTHDMCVDHCHSTGKVRGLLCFHCNTALGHVFEKPQIIDRMKSYLSP